MRYYIRTILKKYGFLVLGAAILSFGLYNVHSQSQITEGGVLGMTLFLHHWTGISPGISGFCMDACCYLLGYKFLGKSFLKKALLASACFSVFYRIHERTGYILPSLSEHPLWAAVLGGLFVGVGVGLIVRSGGASGGDDALVLVISKWTGCSLPRAYFLSDFVVLLLSASYIPVQKIFFSLITVTISSFLIGKIQAFPAILGKNDNGPENA